MISLIQAAGQGSFMPHGMCYLWEPDLLWLHVVSDVLTGAAYYAIPPALVVLVVRGRKAVPEGADYVARALPHEWMFLAFGLFIVACGTTHFFAAWNVWNADYWASGAVKAVTAVASIATASALPPLIPRALHLVRSARESEIHRAHLEDANEELRGVRDALQVELESASEDIRELADEVSRRRRDMQQALEEARSARDEAAAASQAKSEFLAIMSHELRTPLNGILGYADLLENEVRGPLTEGQRDQVERVRFGASHLHGLIDDILVFVRSEGGAEADRRDPVAVRELVDEVTGLLRPETERKGIVLDVEAEDGHVRSHQDWLRRILTNLVSNAVKFTETGGVTVRASVREDVFRVEVSDTGPGIDVDHLERVFDTFWQVDQSPTRRAGGTGLGLSIARRLARQLGGDILLESEPGVGSRFVLEVPAHME